TGTSFSYNSLTAENTTINTGETSKITATASGENLTYNWELISGSLGDILGSGAQVTYTASPCCTGDNTVQCTVSDGTNSESKTVTIVVQ
ncbi:MAG: PKD domain-containing protein, partial [Flavobacteriales bacterium]